MKIIIDISEKDYEFIKSVRSIMKNGDTFERIATDLFWAVQAGEPYEPVVDPCDMNMFEPDEAILGKGMLEE